MACTSAKSGAHPSRGTSIVSAKGKKRKTLDSIAVTIYFCTIHMNSHEGTDFFILSFLTPPPPPLLLPRQPFRTEEVQE